MRTHMVLIVLHPDIIKTAAFVAAFMLGLNLTVVSFMFRDRRFAVPTMCIALALLGACWAISN
jgi:hypothetical protein